MRNFRIFLMKIPGRMKTSIDEHSAIIEAFAATDVDRAEAAIRNHVSSAEQALLQALDAVRMLS
jgi:DNA-binding GntR family transcriptional regulator